MTVNENQAKASEKESLRKRINLFFYTKKGLTLLILLGAALLMSSFYFPYWNLTLKAPQYPEGLRLSVYMDHITGDTSEINLLNHYIGMGKLEDAAHFERKIAWVSLLFLALGAVVFLPIGRKVYKVFYLPPVLFLFGFMGDLFFWLHRAGHLLSPDAPVHIKPFTPILIGSGKIGQFSTFAFFGSGFWMAVTATAVIFVAISRKKPICQKCPDFKRCAIVCNRPSSWIKGH
jgi:copper chaperone NosL